MRSPTMLLATCLLAAFLTVPAMAASLSSGGGGGGGGDDNDPRVFVTDLDTAEPTCIFHEYTVLQDAVDCAAAGATILVGPGTYGPVVVGADAAEDLRVCGWDGNEISCLDDPDPTLRVIDGEGRTALDNRRDRLRVEDIGFRGSGDRPLVRSEGRLLEVQNAHFQMGSGGGIASTGAGTSVTDSRFASDLTDFPTSAAAISVDATEGAVVSDNVITGSFHGIRFTSCVAGEKADDICMLDPEGQALAFTRVNADHNRFGAGLVQPLTLDTTLQDVIVDARSNDWGVAGCDLIDATLAPGDVSNTIRIDPFIHPDDGTSTSCALDVRDHLGLVRPQNEVDPSTLDDALQDQIPAGAVVIEPVSGAFAFQVEAWDDHGVAAGFEDWSLSLTGIGEDNNGLVVTVDQTDSSGANDGDNTHAIQVGAEQFENDAGGHDEFFTNGVALVTATWRMDGALDYDTADPDPVFRLVGTFSDGANDAADDGDHANAEVLDGIVTTIALLQSPA